MNRLTIHQLQAAGGFRGGYAAPSPSEQLRRCRRSPSNLDLWSMGETASDAKSALVRFDRLQRPIRDVQDGGKVDAVRHPVHASSDSPVRGHLRDCRDTRDVAHECAASLLQKGTARSSCVPRGQLVFSIESIKEFSGRRSSIALAISRSRLLQVPLRLTIISRPVHLRQRQHRRLFGRGAVGSGFFAEDRAHGLSLS